MIWRQLLIVLLARRNFQKLGGRRILVQNYLLDPLECNLQLRKGSFGVSPALSDCPLLATAISRKDSRLSPANFEALLA